MSAGEQPGWGSRLAVMLFSLPFMLGFGAGGLFGGVLPLLDTARMAWTVRDWQPVSAQVLETRLDTHRGSKGSITYAVFARYAYRVNGRDHEATRVGLSQWGSDNIGDWHERWHRLLEQARASEQPVGAWYDPQQPGRAVLDRRVRWGMVAFQLPFALLFTAVGIGAAVVFFSALVGKPWAHGRSSVPLRSSRKPVTSAAAGADASQAGPIRPLPAGSKLPPLPAGVRGTLDAPLAELRFVRRWPRVLGGLLLVPALVWLASGPTAGRSGLLALLPMALLFTAWLALALHLITLRWVWRLQGRSLVVDRSSWLFSRRRSFDAGELRQLRHKLVYSSTTGGRPTVHHHRLVATPAHRAAVALTPALGGIDAVRAVAWHLQRAMQLR